MHTITEEMDEGIYICQGMFPINQSVKTLKDVQEKLFYCMRQVALTGIYFCVTGSVDINDDSNGSATISIKNSSSDHKWCNPTPTNSQLAGIDDFLGVYAEK